MRKVITFNIETDNLIRLDSHIVAPCSRSDLMNEILGYMLLNPGTISHFVSKKNTEIQNYIETIPNNA